MRTSALRIGLRSVLSGFVARTALDRHNVLRAFRPVVARADLDPRDWTPGELRHSFVSLLSDSGMSIEQIADLCGYSGTTVIDGVTGTSSDRCS